MQSTKTQEVEVTFIEDDICCPLCESYSIDEADAVFSCYTCGLTWKTLSPER
jgi:hypothetical protein